MQLYISRFLFVAACASGLLTAAYLLAQDAAPPASDDQENATEVETADESPVETEATQGLSLSGWAGLIGIFVLAIFVGFEVITKVPPTLHTPLMSGSNAISGITLAGAIAVAGAYTGGSPTLGSWLGMAAVALATINVVGGFLVTHRMLAMFKKKK